jgi:hypothetical protein
VVVVIKFCNKQYNNPTKEATSFSTFPFCTSEAAGRTDEEQNFWIKFYIFADRHERPHMELITRGPI